MRNATNHVPPSALGAVRFNNLRASNGSKNIKIRGFRRPPQRMQGSYRVAGPRIRAGMHRAARLAAMVAFSMCVVSLPCSEALSLPGGGGNPFAKAVAAFQGLLKRNQPERPPQLSEATSHLDIPTFHACPLSSFSALARQGCGNRAVIICHNLRHCSFSPWDGPVSSDPRSRDRVGEWRPILGPCWVQAARRCNGFANPEEAVHFFGALGISMRNVWDRVPRGSGQSRTSFQPLCPCASGYVPPEEGSVRHTLPAQNQPAAVTGFRRTGSPQGCTL